MNKQMVKFILKKQLCNLGWIVVRGGFSCTGVTSNCRNWPRPFKKHFSLNILKITTMTGKAYFILKAPYSYEFFFSDGISGRDLKPGFPAVDSERTLAEQEELFNKVCEAKLGANLDNAVWSEVPPNK